MVLPKSLDKYSRTGEKRKQFYRFSSLKNTKWLTLKLFTNEGQLILNFNLSRPKIYFPAKKKNDFAMMPKQ